MNIISMTASITALISKYGKNKNPKYLEESEGRITPGKMSAWITVAIGTLMATFSIGAGLSAFASGQNKEDLWTFFLLSLLGLGIAGFMSPSIFSIHDVEWDEDGVTGAKSTFGPTLGWKRHKIRWNEVANRGETMTQYWYLETHDKRRVYWSYLYPGYGKFDIAIRENCPDLRVDN